MTQKRQTISILGATGSIGYNTVDLIRKWPERFDIHLLTAHRNVSALADLIQEFKPKFAVIADTSKLSELRLACSGTSTQIEAGAEALAFHAGDKVDLVVAGIVGIAGLYPVQKAIESGLKIALANKETLVAAGHLIMPSAAKHNAQLLPIDSEHNAIFQCMRDEKKQAIESITLTASGGAFRDFSIEQMQSVTPKQALAHPNWSMGEKVTIDSATLMNKGLELIEAAWLFDLSSAQLDGIIHPQSIIHGLVGFCDGSWIAHLAIPDMRVPISYALGYPQRMRWDSRKLDLLDIAKLDFQAIDTARFPCFQMARQLIGKAPEQAIILNAANEIAVAAFLEQKIGFNQIYESINNALQGGNYGINANSFDAVMALDQEIKQRELHRLDS